MITRSQEMLIANDWRCLMLVLIWKTVLTQDSWVLQGNLLKSLIENTTFEAPGSRTKFWRRLENAGICRDVFLVDVSQAAAPGAWEALRYVAQVTRGDHSQVNEAQENCFLVTKFNKTADFEWISLVLQSRARRLKRIDARAWGRLLEIALWGRKRWSDDFRLISISSDLGSSQIEIATISEGCSELANSLRQLVTLGFT